MAADELLLGSTSIHGLQQAGRKGKCGKFSVAFWCCSFLASIALMSVQLKNVTSLMMSFPKVVKYEVEGGPLTFPAVTLCSLGLVKKSVVDKLPTIIAMESAMKIIGGANHSQNGTIAHTTSVAVSTTSPPETTTSTPSLMCQQSCDYYEPFCFITLAPNSTANYTDAVQQCQSRGASLPTFPTSNYTTFNRFWSYHNTKDANSMVYADYTNYVAHNHTVPGNWADSYGRIGPSNILVWFGNQPDGWFIPQIQYAACLLCDANLTVGSCWFDCLGDARWMVLCMCHCPTPQAPFNGLVAVSNYTDVTMTSIIACNVGFRLIGSAIITCTNVGNGVNWDPYPSCLVDCVEIVSQMFVVTYQNQTDNVTSSLTVAQFSCPTGFTLYGRSSATCYNGTWDILPADYPLCSDFHLPNINESQFLDYAGNDPVEAQYLKCSINIQQSYAIHVVKPSQMASIGFNETDMILKCTFNQQDCAKDSQNGMCYTFNHKNTSQLYSIDRPGEISGLKVLAFTLQDEYLSIVVSGGLKLFIHDQKDPIFYGHNGFMVAPGLTYSIALEKANEVRLNQPAGMCVEEAAEVPFYNFQDTNYFQEACVSSYFQTQIMLKCSCNAPMLPFNNTQVPICGVVQYECVQHVYSGNSSLVEKAKEFCPPRCHYTYYKRTSTTCTSRVNEAAVRKLGISDLAYLKNSIDISIYFQHLDVISLVETISYTVDNLLSDLGASMGVLVGMSVISWVEFIWAIGDCVMVLLRRNKPEVKM